MSSDSIHDAVLCAERRARTPARSIDAATIKEPRYGCDCRLANGIYRHNAATRYFRGVVLLAAQRIARQEWKHCGDAYRQILLRSGRDRSARRPSRHGLLPLRKLSALFHRAGERVHVVETG